MGSFSTNWICLYYVCPTAWNNSEMLSEIYKRCIFIPIDYAISCNIKQNRKMNFTVWFLRHFPTAYFSTLQRPNGTRPITQGLQICRILFGDASVYQVLKESFVVFLAYLRFSLARYGLKKEVPFKLWRKGILWDINLTWCMILKMNLRRFYVAVLYRFLWLVIVRRTSKDRSMKGESWDVDLW